MQRYFFRSTSTMIVRIWSAWLVHKTSEPFDFAPEGVVKLHLDAPDEDFMEFIPSFDVIVLSSGHWFAKQSVYVLSNEIVGGQLWWPDKSRSMKINNIEAFGISTETILTSMVTHPNYTGLTILRSYSPDHYEGGAWNTGGSCTGKVKPLAPGELVENGFTDIMHKKQVRAFDRAIKKATNKSKLRLMDITEPFGYRHDGHPGPYRSPDPNKITKRGPDGRPPPQDCLHWCMPGPVDTWNEFVLEIIRREFERSQSSLFQFGGPTVTTLPASAGTDVKKKRGRPRKYGPDGTLATALSPMPISSSIPLTGELSAWKRGRGRPLESVKKQYKYEYESTGERIAYLVGANFTPHVITVNAGEDVTMKVMSFSQQGARAICILSANGTISNVTLRQPTSSGGTLTYEGRFEILSLSGSFMPTDNGVTKSRSGGMSVSLAGPDGRVVGGGLAGLLVAAGPVQVVVGSFLPGHQQEQKHKKQRTEIAPAITPVSVLSPEEMKGAYGGVKPVLIPSSSFHGDNSGPINPIQAFRNSASDNKTSSPEDESKGLDQSNCEVSS
ncbi:hypothetical protein GH714_026537 [Hevea brasiliensis]|uniref:AT-hook motif nuclear-localized protein n=1 Tax=Hevea brasiliensis TaxID=3981 RepID=A0A6A6MH92_HEVBR|nr:hypothetical protein GH714_026537 [Hevea brasiliensis]